MLDINALVGPVLSAVCAFAGSYLAFSTRLTRVETKVDGLSAKVEKHNNIVERTYKIESEQATMWHRYDELKDEMRDIKIGGTE